MAENWKIPLYKIYSDDEDLQIVNKIIKRGNDWALGPEIEELENLIKKYVGVDYCLALNSGTSSLHSLLIAYNLNKNDEVIVPSFSFISTANSVLFVNSIPKFADIETDNLGLDPKSVETKINQKTKAIIPIDYGGLSCKIFEIKQIAKENNIILIEDAAEALGSTINGKKSGSQADSAIFSFCGNKVITTGEGGAVVTNSKDIYEKIKLIRSHGRMDSGNYFNNPNRSKYVDLGYNWRMSSITAALGISQLNKLDKIIQKRRENAHFISSKLSKNPSIILPQENSEYRHIYQMYTIRLPNKDLRDGLQKHLLDKKIFSKVYFNPIHLTEFYREKFGCKEGQLPNTELISQQVLTIPLYPNMTSEEKNFLVESILEFLE